MATTPPPRRSMRLRSAQASQTPGGAHRPLRSPPPPPPVPPTLAITPPSRRSSHRDATQTPASASKRTKVNPAALAAATPSATTGASAAHPAVTPSGARRSFAQSLAAAAAAAAAAAPIPIPRPAGSPRPSGAALASSRDGLWDARHSPRSGRSLPARHGRQTHAGPSAAAAASPRSPSLASLMPPAVGGASATVGRDGRDGGPTSPFLSAAAAAAASTASSTTTIPRPSAAAAWPAPLTSAGAVRSAALSVSAPSAPSPVSTLTAALRCPSPSSSSSLASAAHLSARQRHHLLKTPTRRHPHPHAHVPQTPAHAHAHPHPRPSPGSAVAFSHASAGGGSSGIPFPTHASDRTTPVRRHTLNLAAEYQAHHFLAAGEPLSPSRGYAYAVHGGTPKRRLSVSASPSGVHGGAGHQDLAGVAGTTAGSSASARSGGAAGAGSGPTLLDPHPDGVRDALYDQVLRSEMPTRHHGHRHGPASSRPLGALGDSEHDDDALLAGLPPGAGGLGTLGGLGATPHKAYATRNLFTFHSPQTAPAGASPGARRSHPVGGGGMAMTPPSAASGAPRHSPHHPIFSLSALRPSTQELLLAASPRHNAALAQHGARDIAKTPYKVLDAPDLQDDFYLHLVDWGATNVLAAGLGTCVYLWSAQTGHVTKLVDLAEEPPSTADPAYRADTLDTNPAAAAASSLSPADHFVTSVAWMPRGTHLAVGTQRGTVQLWDVGRCRKIREFRGHLGRVGCLAWQPAIAGTHTTSAASAPCPAGRGGSVLSSGSRDRTILHRDVRVAGDAVGRWAVHRQEVCGLTWHPDGGVLASGGNDNTVLVWDGRGTATAAPAAGTSPAAAAPAMSPALASSTTAPLHRLTAHTAAVKALAWSPRQAHLLASGGGTADRTIRFWNTATGAALARLDAGSQVSNIAWSPHANEFVSTHGYSRNAVVVWRYPSLRPLATLTGHTCRVLQLALSPDGQDVVTGAGDETLRFWRVFHQGKRRRGLAGLDPGFAAGEALVPSSGLTSLTRVGRASASSSSAPLSGQIR